MNEAPDPKRPAPPALVAVERVKAGRDVIIANSVTLQLDRGEKSWTGFDSGTVHDAGSQEHRPPATAAQSEAARAASAFLRQPDTCVYLGRRYGLTPHSPVTFRQLEGPAVGSESPEDGSLGEAVSWLAGQVGRSAAQRHLAERYSYLDEVAPEVGKELTTLATLAAGRVLVTGSYSARIQNTIGPALTVVQTDRQAAPRRKTGRSQRTHLVLLHGSEQDFQSAMVLENEVATYRDHRPSLTATVSELLENPWVVLGAERRADTTFHLLADSVCQRLGMLQRPLFVVDPRPEQEVAREWPQVALRHVRMTPMQFLSLASSTP